MLHLSYPRSTSMPLWGCRLLHLYATTLARVVANPLDRLQLAAPQQVKMLRCCGAQLALADALLSKQFHSKNGPAWLFQTCVNVLPGPQEERLMTTGMHVVADIACAKCLNVVGWKYEAASEESQKYKEGKFILERIHVVESDSNSNMSPPRFRPFAHPMHRSDSSGSDSY